MFQVLLQYFEDRFASFYVDEPLSNYQDLLDRVKKVVPFLQGVDDQQIVISCKELSLRTFIYIDRNDSLHVSESFRNASPCGSDKFNNVRARSCSFLPTGEGTFEAFEAINQFLLRFVPVLNQTSTGQLFSPSSQALWYDYNVCG